MLKSHRIWSASCFIGAVLWALPARADLKADADRLQQAFSAYAASLGPSVQARIERLPPVFAEAGRPVMVKLPDWAVAKQSTLPLALGAEKDNKNTPSDCMTVVVLGPRTGEFSADIDDSGSGEGIFLRRMERKSASAANPVQMFGHPGTEMRNGEENPPWIKSSGGALRYVRCGKAREQAKYMMLELVSSRAVLETLVITGVSDSPPVEQILPERAFGPLIPREGAGRPVEPGPLLERLARAEKRARADGARHVERLFSRASLMGAGEFLLRLPEGCHRLEVMAEVPNFIPRRATDVDAEARLADGGALLARDRADSPDARLDFCLGEPSAVEVPFVGAAGPVSVFISDASWPIPDTIPSYWGPRARAAFAYAVRRRNAPVPAGPPVMESLGVQGETLVAAEVFPGRCYLAVVGLVRGEARGLRLSVDLSGRVYKDETRDRIDGVAVAFCAENESSVPLRVSARGNSSWWALSLWQMN